MLKLSGEQIAQLQRAILAVFTHDELRQLLLTDLDRDLSHVSLGGNLTPAVFDVITQAEREGWTEELLDAVTEARPQRKDLQLLFAAIARVVQSPPERKEIPCPYRGLEFFDVATRPLLLRS